MQEIIFILRTVTPLFLAGADQSAAELRAPSFRGLMRYWYRALVGGLVGTDDAGLKKVSEAEKALFGATDTGSAISLRVSRPSQEAKEFTEQVSRRDATGRWQATGKGYLLWSMSKSGSVERRNLKPARWYFPPGTKFEVTLAARHGYETHLPQAVAAFWLLTQLGSLGSRARRCAGSLAVASAPKWSGKNLAEQFSFSQAATAQALKQQLESGIREARKLSIQENQPVQVQQANFDILAKGTCRIWILQDAQVWTSADIAMTRLGERLQSYRGEIDINQRRIFGLPLPPKFVKERRSSPLLLRVTELQGNRYVGIAVLFKTSGKGVQVRDYAIIEHWVNGFQGKLEVTL